MKYEELKKIVKNKFKNNPSRYIHTLGVVEMSIKLAEKYNLNKEEIKIAALLHDYTKYDSLEFHKKNISEEDYIKYKDQKYLLHAISASNIIENEFNIRNKNIKTAIRYHVYGNINMTKFTKVVLISDKIEENRNYPMVEKLRKTAFENIDLAIILFLKDNIRYNKSKGYKISNEMLETLKYLKKEYYEKNKTNKYNFKQNEC